MSWSIGTKLLISIVALLITVIIFLSVSTIFILKEDKRAYIYKSQLTEGVLAGRDFANATRHGLDSLRAALVAIDPARPVSASEHAAIQSLISNQSEIASALVGLIDPRSGEFKVVAKASKETALREINFAAKDLESLPAFLKGRLPELRKSGYAFANVSKPGAEPALGVAFIDLNTLKHGAGISAAVGVMSLKNFASGVSGLNLTILSRDGWVLFDTDAARSYTKHNLRENVLFQTASTSGVASGAREYDSQGVHYLGSYVKTGSDLIILSRTEWLKAMKATYTVTEKLLLLGLMAISAAVIFGIFFSKTLTAPIQSLYDATRKVASGDFALALKPRSRDEIGALTSSFNVMSEKIVELIKDKVEQAHLEQELAITATIQQTLIPQPAFQNENIVIRSHYQAADQCGGDWWGFFGVGNRLVIMIADATGHGLPSALMTACARSCFSVMNKLAQEDPEFAYSPGAMLAYANRVIYDGSLGKIMMTAFLGVIDFDSRTLTFASAGHNPPWLFRKGGGSGFSMNSLTATGQRLGEARDIADYEEKSVPIDPSDVLFLYTDGLMEGKDKAGEMYGKKRVKKLLEKALSGGPDGALNDLLKDFMKHNEGKSLDDDVTLALAVLLPSGAQVHA